MDPVLNYGVTGFGFVLGALSFAVIFLGKPIPGDSGTSQELEFKGFKMKTNGVVMLLAVSVLVAVLPLTLQAWLEGRKPVPVQSPGPSAQPSRPPDLQIFITGQVLDTGGPVDGAKVTVTNMRDVKPGEAETPLASRVTDSSGSFDFPALKFGEGDRYKVVAAKEGHVEQYFYMGPSGAVDVRTVLVAKRKDGGG